MQYPLTEFFHSIQGEGFWKLTPMTFIRLAGCNYKCTWCDTDFTKKMAGDERYIVAKVREVTPKGTHHFCLTGGEPLMYDLVPVIEELNVAYKHPLIHIETNGAFPDAARRLKSIFGGAVWITVSPKKPNGDPLDEFKGAVGDEIKLVYQGQDVTRFDQGDDMDHYLQPLWHDDITIYRKRIEQVLRVTREHPAWELSVQTHKLLGMA